MLPSVCPKPRSFGSTRAESRQLILEEDMPGEIDAHYDLRDTAWLPLIGDANDLSERGDGLGDDDCSYIDAGEANFAGSDGAHNGNRFSDRHYGGTNYLFADMHATRSTVLRTELARDYDLNGIDDIDVDP